jgi:hypothetical protein
MRIIGLISILLASSALAQPLPAKKSPDLLLLENEMLETSYLAKANPANRAAYIKSSEELLPLFCKASQEKPEYIPETCQNIINKLKKIEENNPKAICFEMGFGDPKCKASSQDPNAPKLSPYDQLKQLLDQPPAPPKYSARDMQDPDRQAVRKISDQLLGAHLQYRQTQSAQDKQQVLRLYSQILPQVCKLNSPPPYQPTYECRNYAEQSLAFDPEFATAKCYLQGPTSSFCQGRAAQNKPQNSNTTKSTGGFTEF